ncbi:hypothetical protein F2P44_16130 [Massilia sp. CCM 8695]|uniref:Uncharacterized protein n=1 Tax=Massilia frigida TaxID=2609281 RepID=A0ABX0ND53_9BURK|nr:hypothetical protein [Massilia frigida]NHZ80789.1 hypothetical protein [Massilia frigida]
MERVPLDNPIRRFGQAVDLDLDFDQSDRPSLVTALLAQCSLHGDAGYWWSQPVGARSAALLRLLIETEGTRQLDLSARCSHPPCAAAFEFELSLQALAACGGDGGPLHIVFDDARCVSLRRPTGADLRDWRGKPAATRDEALGMMLATLLLDGEVRLQDEARLSAAIAELDPLIDFTVDCACPVCATPNQVALDLEALALSRLAARQRLLLREVHELASHYGWTEQEALAVPAPRRAQYLALCEAAR